MSNFQSLGDLMAEEEARLVDEARVQMEAERVAWDALSPAEQAAISAANAARYEAMFDGVDLDEDPEDDEDEDLDE